MAMAMIAPPSPAPAIGQSPTGGRALSESAGRGGDVGCWRADSVLLPPFSAVDEVAAVLEAGLEASVAVPSRSLAVASAVGATFGVSMAFGLALAWGVCVAEADGLAASAGRAVRSMTGGFTGPGLRSAMHVFPVRRT